MNLGMRYVVAHKLTSSLGFQACFSAHFAQIAVPALAFLMSLRVDSMQLVDEPLRALLGLRTA
jgi:hypothetical protein